MRPSEILIALVQSMSNYSATGCRMEPEAVAKLVLLFDELAGQVRLLEEEVPDWRFGRARGCEQPPWGWRDAAVVIPIDLGPEGPLTPFGSDGRPS